MSFHEIGSFQFENLVRNRIPFVLLNLTKNPLKLFSSFHQSHLDQNSLNTTAESAVLSIRKTNAPAEQAIVVICEDGQVSVDVVSSLMEAGYINVFSVAGGRRQITADILSG